MSDNNKRRRRPKIPLSLLAGLFPKRRFKRFVLLSKDNHGLRIVMKFKVSREASQTLRLRAVNLQRRLLSPLITAR